MAPPTELSLLASRIEKIGAPYMITGATAAIVYGQPRVTNDLDVVLDLDDAHRNGLIRAFPESDFYVPPESTIAEEQARPRKGHCNIIHHESGYKADIYLAGDESSARVGNAAATPDRVDDRTYGLRSATGIRRPAQARVLPRGRLVEAPRRHSSNPVDHWAR